MIRWLVFVNIIKIIFIDRLLCVEGFYVNFLILFLWNFYENVDGINNIIFYRWGFEKLSFLRIFLEFRGGWECIVSLIVSIRLF